MRRRAGFAHFVELIDMIFFFDLVLVVVATMMVVFYVSLEAAVCVVLVPCLSAAALCHGLGSVWCLAECCWSIVSVA